MLDQPLRLRRPHLLEGVADGLEGFVLGGQLLAPLVSQTTAPALELVGAPDEEVFLGPLRAEAGLELLKGRAEVFGEVVALSEARTAPLTDWLAWTITGL
ncbi:hypothetical protein ACWDZX_12480 [Streptomyces collinus]